MAASSSSESADSFNNFANFLEDELERSESLDDIDSVLADEVQFISVPQSSREDDEEEEEDEEDEKAAIEKFPGGEKRSQEYPDTRPAKRSTSTSPPTSHEYSREADVEGMQCPPHPGFAWGICIRCGQLKPKTFASTSSNRLQTTSAPDTVALKYIHESLELSTREAERIRKEELVQLLSQKRLYLVLDLDHTLLNSARVSEVSQEDASHITSVHWGEASSGEGSCTTAPESTLFHLPHIGMWTKLRPGVQRLLSEASKMYEMTVYTNGEKGYAVAMAALLDPTGQLFNGRVISHGDSTRKGTKDLDIMLGAESAVIILDDSPQVWPKHRDNVIVVHRYHYFSSSARQFGLSSPSLVERRVDESQSEGAMAALLPALQKIHSKFFESQQDSQIDAPDVRQALNSVKATILEGCSIVFSRVFPVGPGFQPPEFNPLWKLAVSMGAICQTQTGKGTTHVVAMDAGTEKAKWALEHSVHLVRPEWLEASYYAWKKREEEDFLVVEEMGKSGREG